MSFLPEDYQEPAAGGKYTKFQGETRLRILSDVEIGFEYWATDGKPRRLRHEPKLRPADMREMDQWGKAERMKFAWAVVVYNYNTEQIEVCQINQATVREQLTGLFRDSDWGHPKHFDVKVKKTGTGTDTVYIVSPVSPKPIDEKVKEAIRGAKVNIKVLFDGGDPFAGAKAEEAAAAAEAPAPAPAPKKVAKPEPVAAGDDDLPF